MVNDPGRCGRGERDSGVGDGARASWLLANLDAGRISQKVGVEVRVSGWDGGGFRVSNCVSAGGVRAGTAGCDIRLEVSKCICGRLLICQLLGNVVRIKKLVVGGVRVRNRSLVASESASGPESLTSLQEPARARRPFMAEFARKAQKLFALGAPDVFHILITVLATAQTLLIGVNFLLHIDLTQDRPRSPHRGRYLLNNFWKKMMTLQRIQRCFDWMLACACRSRSQNDQGGSMFISKSVPMPAEIPKSVSEPIASPDSAEELAEVAKSGSGSEAANGEIANCMQEWEKSLMDMAAHFWPIVCVCNIVQENSASTVERCFETLDLEGCDRSACNAVWDDVGTNVKGRLASIDTGGFEGSMGTTVQEGNGCILERGFVLHWLLGWSGPSSVCNTVRDDGGSIVRGRFVLLNLGGFDGKFRDTERCGGGSMIKGYFDPIGPWRCDGIVGTIVQGGSIVRDDACSIVGGHSALLGLRDGCNTLRDGGGSIFERCFVLFDSPGGCDGASPCTDLLCQTSGKILNTIGTMVKRVLIGNTDPFALGPGSPARQGARHE